MPADETEAIELMIIDDWTGKGEQERADWAGGAAGLASLSLGDLDIDDFHPDAPLPSEKEEDKPYIHVDDSTGKISYKTQAEIQDTMFVFNNWEDGKEWRNEIPEAVHKRLYAQWQAKRDIEKFTNERKNHLKLEKKQAKAEKRREHLVMEEKRKAQEALNKKKEKKENNKLKIRRREDGQQRAEKQRLEAKDNRDMKNKEKSIEVNEFKQKERKVVFSTATGLATRVKHDQMNDEQKKQQRE